MPRLLSRGHLLKIKACPEMWEPKIVTHIIVFRGLATGTPFWVPLNEAAAGELTKNR